MGKTGRPPLEPRIAELERQVQALGELFTALQAQVNHQQMSVPRGTYQSQFDKWPDARVTIVPPMNQSVKP
jgi:hypothetical protein